MLYFVSFIGFSLIPSCLNTVSSLINRLSLTSRIVPSSQVRVVLLAAAPADQLFVLTGGEDELDRQLLDDLGLGEVRPVFFSLLPEC